MAIKPRQCEATPSAVTLGHSVLALPVGPSATLVPAPRIGAVDQRERADGEHEKQYEHRSHGHTVPVRIDKHKSSYRSC
jgi:hypothetical protein